MGNLRRPRPHGYHIIENGKRENIAPLFRSALPYRGQIYSGHLNSFDLPYEIYLSLEPDFAGSWIRIAGGDDARWSISVDRYVRWRNNRGWMKPNPNFGGRVRQVQAWRAFVVGILDSTRRSPYLLMTDTRLIGTVGDTGAVYSKASQLSKKQRRIQRRRELIKPILPFVDDAWIRDHMAWWPNRWEKPKWWKFVHFWRVVGELRHSRRYGRGEYIPDPEPKVIHRRRKRPKGPVQPPMDMGHGDLADMERIGLKLYRR
jgi:hypothetical protein